MPYSAKTFPLTYRRRIGTCFGEVKFETFGKTRGQAADHPALLKGVNALEVLSHQKKALDKLYRPAFPKIKVEEVLCPIEELGRCCFSFLCHHIIRVL